MSVVPPDPFMPFLFMGEEIAITMRMWTSGFDVYAPEQGVLGHEYVRKHGTKFWESVNEVYSSGSMHNSLTALVVRRVQHLLGASTLRRSDPLLNTTLVRMKDFGAGNVRSLQSFLEVHGIDVEHRKQKPPDWCMSGVAPSAAMEYQRKRSGR